MTGPSPFSTESVQKAVHATLDDAYEAIPAGHTHALIFDGTASTANGAGVRGMYVQKLGNGWNVALEGEVVQHGGAKTGVVVAKSW